LWRIAAAASDPPDAIAFLQQAGFKKLLNLKGGILAWADDVDPSMPKY
jgi:rhodanese-related sulfurtransferase